MTNKATAYPAAGVARVWVVDARAQTITSFQPQAVPITYRADRAIADDHLPGLSLTAQQLFTRAGLA